MTVKVTIEVPKETLATLKQDPQGFAREMRLVAAAKWYDMGTAPKDEPPRLPA